MVTILPSASVTSAQQAISDIYAIPDDQLYSVWDLLSNQERFTMRALKGIRKDAMGKLKLNLVISLSWLMAIMNRFHIDLEGSVWNRFPFRCSYCGKTPCICKKEHPKKRVRILQHHSKKPNSLSKFQEMLRIIYPTEQRTLEQAGIHLAEELGELSEAIYLFLGEHKEKYFKTIEEEAADLFSCSMGVANSARIDVANEYTILFKNNCHVCHKAPCICNFPLVAKFKS